jgi:hypothetical protein
MTPLKRAALAVISILLTGRLALGPFREGWTEMHTDFPNHWVAAKLALHHQPLREFYDWEWFQRQIQVSGIDRQLGGYIPYPPLAMLPFLPLAELPPQQAKQLWLVEEVVFLGLSIWLLSRLTKLSILETMVLALAAYTSLAQNFVLGHVYIFLLFLLSAAVFFLLRGRDFLGGVLLGLIFSLKLYAAPFAFFFLLRRQWRAFWGMIVSIVLLTLLAITWFGFDAVAFYATSVMTRGLDGSIVDPYNPGLGSMAVLLRKLFVPEVELNPHPLLNAPAAFFFLQAFYSLGLLAAALLALPKRSQPDDVAVAWFILVLFALSPVTAYSHFVLLLVPVVVLASRASPAWATGLIALYVLVQLPTRPWDAWLFPKLWFSLALVAYVGWKFRPNIRLKPALIALTLIAVASGIVAWKRWTNYQAEPPQTAERVAPQPGALFSSAPAIGANELIYESMEDQSFGLRTAAKRFVFDGQAFHPSVPTSGSPVYIELVSQGHSQIAALDPASGSWSVIRDAGTEPAVSPDGTKLTFVLDGSLFVGQRLLAREVWDPDFLPDGQRIAFAQGFPGTRSIRVVPASGGEPVTLIEGGDNFEPAVSPDGKSLAYVHQEIGSRQVWIRNLESGESRRLTTGACNNDHPAWEPDSHSLVFASDCSRGYGLPALYKIGVP